MNLKDFFAELKRRNVYKVAVAYGVIAWLLLQGASIVLPSFEAPAWAMKVLIAALAVGFPMTVVLAWAFELTPEGVVRAEDVAPDKSLTRKTGRKLTVVIVVIGAVAAAMFAFQFVRPKASSTVREERAATEKSIAVLPFENASGNADTEYLSDGISEALINSLTELQQLKVIARSTAFRYKGKEIDPQAVGRELKVRTVLMGLVRQLGDRLTVQVDLVDAVTGAQLWGEEYERKVADVLSVKQNIVREVTEKLRLRLSGDQKQHLTKRDTTNPEAYQSYLRGRYYWNKRTAENIRKAIEQFQQAIERDPNYALGHVGLADCYTVLELYAGIPAAESLPKARAAADRALQLDDSLAEAHTSSAHVYQHQWHWAEAEKEYRRAISLNPNYPTAHHWFAVYFFTKRQFDDALREIRRAQELDPLSSIIGATSAYILLLKNDLDSALAECRRVIELDPNFPSAHLYLAWAYFQQQRYEDATAEFRAAVESSGRASFYLSDLGYAYAVGGRRAEALMILAELEEKYARREAIGVHVAAVYAGLGDKTQVFSWLERDLEQRSGSEVTGVTYHFPFDNLRGDPRYAELVRRMGLQP